MSDGELSSSYALTIDVFDGVHTTAGNVTINVDDVNDVAPVLNVNSFAIQEGELLTIDGLNLAASDVDSPDSSLIFSISNLSGGQFELAETLSAE